MTDSTTKAKDEARARELSEAIDSEPRYAAKDEAVLRLIQEVRAERDAELQRAMAVVEVAIVEFQSGAINRDVIGEALVTQGFITPTGDRK